MGDILVSGGTAGYVRNVSAYGNGVLEISDIKYHSREMFLEEPNQVHFQISNGVTGVENGFFHTFPTLVSLEISTSVEYMDESPETIGMMKENDVLILGFFDTPAESFARKHGLRFAHADIRIAVVDDPVRKYECNIITLCLPPDGSPFINQNCICPGISAGNNGGGEINVPLPDDFFMTMSAKDIADRCWRVCHEAISSGEALNNYLKGAKKRAEITNKE